MTEKRRKKWRPRSLDELAAAIAYLEFMEDQSRHDPDIHHGELVGKVAAKGAQMLLWAAGEDNEFGRMVSRAIRISNEQRGPVN